MNKTAKVLTLGAMTDELFDLREERRKLEARVTEINQKYEEIEEALLKKLEGEDSSKATGSKASVSITSTTVATVKDWDDLWKWIRRTNNFQLCYRRVNDAAWREVFSKKGIAPPGTEPFIKKKLNLRVL